ncbi:MAG: GNAT family N-acetyltransferase [Sulfurimonas sp.]|nr:GNAT family N-acetyltransferase [Sulfurimonas sp.]MDQ7062010.1 GNAT family N-acetyltransferase [Sulfurimonas sp.]
MQIRELDLKELDSVYSVLKQLHQNLSYKEFEDLIYDMRDMEYTMIGIFENDKLISYAGVAVQTNLYNKRHLYVFELVTDAPYRKKGYGKKMLDYLEDYSRVAMCEKIIFHSIS